MHLRQFLTILDSSMMKFHFFRSEKHRGLLASVAVEKYSCQNGVAKEKAEGRSASSPLEVDSGAASGGKNFLLTSATTTDSIRFCHRESC